MLGTYHPSLERRDERIGADLDQPRRTRAFLPDHRRGSLDQGLLGNPVQITGSHFHIGSGVTDVLPRYFHEPGPLLRIDRNVACFLRHKTPPIRRTTAIKTIADT